MLGGLVLVLASCGGGVGEIPKEAQVLKPGVGFYELISPKDGAAIRLGDAVSGRVWLRGFAGDKGKKEKGATQILDVEPKGEGFRLRWTGKTKVLPKGEGAAPLFVRPFRAWFLRTGARVLPAFQTHLATVKERKVEVKGLLPKGAKGGPELPDSLIRDPEPSFPWLWAGLGAGVLVLAVGLFLWLKRKRGRGFLPKPIPIPPGRFALIQLKELAQSLEEGTIRSEELVDQVTRVLRRYLDEALGLHTREQTTEEILRDLAEHPQLGEAQRARLAGLVQQADLVKFAGQGADLELSRELLGGARTLVLGLEEERKRGGAEVACA